ncbi:glycosyltransferase 87 family protein [uncultured Methylobacterium sp.]|uniref:glycosyltransferase 87 family protein n=1 Tax=uncultured Methylobacterium sp. TaxID=157278 RepID=UPI0035CA57E6
MTDAANVLERHYPYPDHITAVGLGTAEAFRAAYPAVAYRQISADCRLPFPDGSFDIATSNAVLEHVGSPENQRLMVREMLRVARVVFLTVPHRYFPIEHHTAIPFLHYHDATFRWACGRLGKATWADERNLILMSRARLAAVTLSQIPAGRRVGALVMLALAPACLINAVGGQNCFLTASLLLGGLLALDRRPILAGILFGLLTCKPHLGLVLPFALLALGAWRTIGAAALTTLALVAASVGAFGIEPWQHYLGATSAFQYSLLERFSGFYPYMMASVFAGARTAGLGMSAAWILQAAVSLHVLGLTVWAVRRTRDPRLRAGVLAAAAMLLTPYAFNYDLTAVAAILTWRLFRADGEEAPGRVTILAWVLPAMIMPLQMHGFGGGSLVLIALFAVLIREVAAEMPQTAPPMSPAMALG